MASNVRLMECKSCAAHFDEMLPACPYCGTASIKGAQAQYMDKLEDIRSDVEELENVPADVAKNEVWKPIVLVLVSVFVCVALLWVWFKIDTRPDKESEERDSKANYIWLQENVPILDELYEQEEHEQLMARYEEAVAEGKPIHQWEHYHFCIYLQRYFEVKEILDRETAGEELSVYDYKLLLYMYYESPRIMESGISSQEERDKLQPYVQMLEEDYKARWLFTQEELNTLEQKKDSDGYLSREALEPVVKAWMERNNK